ncbi:MAG: S8 family serine peptidase [Anaerolineae bacterium]|nr:S8 family serine peptidase [Anaerolineae bacterium]
MKRTIIVLAVLVLLAAMLPVSAAAQGSTRSYIIMAHGNALPAKLAQKVKAAGGTLTRTIPEIGIAVASSSNPNFAANASRISGLRSVIHDVSIQWIDPNLVQYQLDVQFSDPPTSGDDDFFFDLQWGHAAVDSPIAWNAGARGNNVRVAVLDSGIDADHPDIAPNLNVGLSASFVPGEGFDIEPGFYFNHGTHVAGIVAAADNAFGTIGVAPEAEIVAVKVLSEFTGSGSFEGVIAGIVYAANIDADIINMSLGATLKKSGFCDLEGCVTAREVAELLVASGRATTYAYQQGTTVIAAAGNESMDADHTANLVFVPAALPHVVSVAATGPLGWALDPSTDLDVPAFYTNFGQSFINFAAPGGNVDFGLFESNVDCTVTFVTVPCWVFDLVFSTISEGWGWAAGTSMATPHTSGVAAIIIGQNGGSMNPAHVEQALRAYADDLGKKGNDDFYGAGRVNAGNSVP